MLDKNQVHDQIFMYFKLVLQACFERNFDGFLDNKSGQ